MMENPNQMERTLCIIKPDAVKMNHTGNIIQMITDAGFKILGLRMCRLNQTTAGAFYEVHRGKPFFQGLVDYMTSGPIVAIALEKENAIRDYRELIGATNPAQAAEGTVRKLYGISLTSNAVHGSDSKENGAVEVGFFFSRYEIENQK
jgi:nucleoside-diphosphate kinase